MTYVIQPVFDPATGTFGSRRIKRNPWRKGRPPDSVRTFVGFYGPGDVYKIEDWSIHGRTFPTVVGVIDALPFEVELREPLAWRPA